jgi:hypothetical protein
MDGTTYASNSSIDSKCYPVFVASDLEINQQYSWKQLKSKTFRDFDHTTTPIPKPDLTADSVAAPCGLIAKSMFNDTYQILYSKNKEDFADQVKVD